MKFLQQLYRADLITEVLKSPQLFIAQQGNMNSQKWIDLSHKFSKENIKIFKVQNNLVQKLYSQSKFFNLSNLIQGSLIIGYSKEIYHSDKISKLLENFTLLCIKDHSKFYTPKETKSLFLNSNNVNTHINLILGIYKTSLLLCLNFSHLYSGAAIS